MVDNGAIKLKKSSCRPFILFFLTIFYTFLNK